MDGLTESLTRVLSHRFVGTGRGDIDSRESFCAAAVGFFPPSLGILARGLFNNFVQGDA